MKQEAYTKKYIWASSFQQKTGEGLDVWRKYPAVNRKHSTTCKVMKCSCSFENLRKFHGNVCQFQDSDINKFYHWHFPYNFLKVSVNLIFTIWYGAFTRNNMNTVRESDEKPWPDFWRPHCDERMFHITHWDILKGSRRNIIIKQKPLMLVERFWSYIPAKKYLKNVNLKLKPNCFIWA